MEKGRTGHFTKNCEAGSIDQRHESGRPKHARTEEDVTTVDEPVVKWGGSRMISAPPPLI